MGERWNGCTHEIESSDDYFVVEVQRDQIEGNGDLAPEGELALRMCMACAERVQPRPGGLLAKKVLGGHPDAAAPIKGVTAKLMEAAAKLMGAETWECGGCGKKLGSGEALVSTEFKTRSGDSLKALLLTLQCCEGCEPKLMQELSTLLDQPVSLNPVEEIPQYPPGEFAIGSQVRHARHGEGEVLFSRSGFEKVKVRFGHGIEKVLVDELDPC